MPDRDRETQAARNRNTLLQVRVPAGLKPGAENAVRAFVAAALGPDIQYFDSSGTWVKPPRAVRVDIVLQGAGAGHGWIGQGDAVFTRAHLGRKINPNGYVVSNGEPGEIRVNSLDAADLPDEVEVEVGKGGRPGGRDGYALIITHLAGEEGEQR
jgi:hypothetical protein